MKIFRAQTVKVKVGLFNVLCKSERLSFGGKEKNCLSGQTKRYVKYVKVHRRD